MLEQRPDHTPIRPRSTRIQRLVAAVVSNVVVAEVIWLSSLAGLTAADYSWGLFVLAPFFVGMLGTLILGWKEDRTLKECRSSAWMSCGIALVAAMLVAQEGLICACMASPLYLLLLMLGTYAGHRLLDLRWGGPNRPRLMASVLLALPLAMSAGGFGEAPTSLRRVQTSKLIDAAPEAIWPLLYNLPDLPESRFWMFRSGVAHPTAIRMAGNTRYCLLTTGPMPERIIRADKNQCLEFEVLATPPTMKEVNPFVHASPKHLTGYFSCVRGRFDLERLPDGRTRVTGTSWYRCHFAPAWYWNLWTDTIVRHVHLEVLDAMAARVGRGRQE